MIINDIINTLSNKNDFHYTILEEEQAYSHYFDSYFDIPNEWLDKSIKNFTIGWEDIIFCV